MNDNISLPGDDTTEKDALVIVKRGQSQGISLSRALAQTKVIDRRPSTSPTNQLHSQSMSAFSSPIKSASRPNRRLDVSKSANGIGADAEVTVPVTEQ